MAEKTAELEVLFIKIDRTLKDGVAEAASAEDRTLSSYVRTVLRRAVAEHRRQTAQAEPAIAA